MKNYNFYTFYKNCKMYLTSLSTSPTLPQWGMRWNQMEGESMYNEIEKYRLRNRMGWDELACVIGEVTGAAIPPYSLRDVVLHARRRCKQWKREALIDFATYIQLHPTRGGGEGGDNGRGAVGVVEQPHPDWDCSDA